MIAQSYITEWSEKAPWSTNVQAEPIRETIDHLRDALAWLGEPVVKQKKHNNTLVFKVHPTDAGAGEISTIRIR